jgi:mannan endo-1,4-beta-mannosidase
MKVFPLLAAALCSLSFSTTAFAAKSFSASNLYYAAGLKDSQQTALFDGLKSAGVKVLRVWLDGKCSVKLLALQFFILNYFRRRPIGQYEGH